MVRFLRRSGLYIWWSPQVWTWKHCWWLRWPRKWPGGRHMLSPTRSLRQHCIGRGETWIKERRLFHSTALHVRQGVQRLPSKCQFTAWKLHRQFLFQRPWSMLQRTTSNCRVRWDSHEVSDQIDWRTPERFNATSSAEIFLMTFSNYRIFIRRCIKYSIDAMKPSTWQWFDLPFFDDEHDFQFDDPEARHFAEKNNLLDMNFLWIYIRLFIYMEISHSRVINKVSFRN